MLLAQLRTYNGKILLFGEYTTLFGSAALAIPYPKLSGQWSKQTKRSDRLLELHKRLEKLDGIHLDLARFKDDLDQYLHFESNIPEGYGIGSSGSLTAALFDRYGNNTGLSMEELKTQLGDIEAIFHGKSSGMDPLISFMNCPIIKHKDGALEMILDELALDIFEIELIDSGKKRETEPLVKDFFVRVASDHQFKRSVEEMSTLNDQAILALQTKHFEAFFETLNEISRLQLDTLSFLIPEAVSVAWNESLLSSDTSIKLCGAGGGGYFLKIKRIS